MVNVKVAIVEKGPSTVHTLEQSVNWDKLDCRPVGSVCGGKEGLKLILREAPDIVLADIDLSDMNGLDMISDVRRLTPKPVFIVLSERDDFSCTGRAIRLGVFDYLLKPVKADEIERALQRAVLAAEYRQKEQAAIDQVNRLQTRAQLLSLLTNMSHTGQNILTMMKEAGLHCTSYFLMILQPEEAGGLPLSMMDGPDRLLQELGLHAISVILYDSLVLYVMRDSADSSWTDEAIKICDAMRLAIPERVNIGISTLETSHHRVRETYQQARQALYESAMHPDSDENVFYRENMSNGSGVLTDMRHRVDELAEAAQLTDESADFAAAELVRLSGQQYSQLRAMVSLYAMLVSRKFPCNVNGAVDKALSNTWFVTEESNVASCLRAVCAALREGRAEEEGKCSLLTRNVLAYIHIHGTDKLSLSDVSGHFHVSANYLSALVRKETGVTFHDHIINVKMDIARKMLADPRVLVEEVAYAIGYSNYVSFYNVFKQKEHMTPTEYRAMLAQK